MRIRRKKHLDERLKGVSERLIVADKDCKDVRLAAQNKRLVDFNNFFGNNNPIRMEVGCGKGGFIAEHAKLNPNVNFIAVELLENIIVMAAENSVKLGLNNVAFFNSGADYLVRYIKPESLEKIYLNFSPPFPGDRYENRRLTKPALIENYKEFLINGGEILQKTDDKEFFEYSLSQFEKAGFKVTDISGRLMDGSIDNVETEYEKKFRSQGMPIYGLIAVKG